MISSWSLCMPFTERSFLMDLRLDAEEAEKTRWLPLQWEVRILRRFAWLAVAHEVAFPLDHVMWMSAGSVH